MVTTDLQVRAVNLATDKYAKDYDAVFSVDRSESGESSLTIAVEYERTLKAEDRYAEISNALSGDAPLTSFFIFFARPPTWYRCWRRGSV